MPNIGRREQSRLKAEIAEGLTDYVDQRSMRTRVRRCGVMARTHSVRWWKTVLGEIALPKGAFLIFSLMKGAPYRLSVLN